jgi:hypothetical protein
MEQNSNGYSRITDSLLSARLGRTSNSHFDPKDIAIKGVAS